MKPFTVFWAKNLSGRGVYTGTAKQISEWMESPGSDDPEIWQVRDNLTRTFIPGTIFLQTFRKSEEVAKQARNAKVLQLVISAMGKQATATHFGDVDGMDIVAVETSKAIIKLFEGE